MIQTFHFLRPWCLGLLIPHVLVFCQLARRNPPLKAWSAVCDAFLLTQLVHYSGQKNRYFLLSGLFISIACVIVSMAGPAWSKYPVPSYAQILPRVVVLDMSSAMLERDLAPDRLTRAKFKLHDLLGGANSKQFSRGSVAGQWGFVVFTSEPFVVSPLTEDTKTIDTLLENISPSIMPVTGYRLDLALEEAATVIHQAGLQQGQLLVLTAETPNAAAMEVATHLAQGGIITSVMPLRAKEEAHNALFKQLAVAGNGLLLPFTDNTSDLTPWLALQKGDQRFQFSAQDTIAVWRDEGRWFLIPALVFILPVFRRGWLQRVAS
jgi:Ca-activated chloride channel family protein